MGKYTGTQERILSQIADAGGSLKQLVSEDNGQWSATRSWGWLIVGIVADDIVVRGTPLSWMHVAILGVVASMKVAQKWAEKPAQGVINARALDAMMQGIANRMAAKTESGATEGKT